MSEMKKRAHSLFYKLVIVPAGLSCVLLSALFLAGASGCSTAGKLRSDPPLPPSSSEQQPGADKKSSVHKPKDSAAVLKIPAGMVYIKAGSFMMGSAAGAANEKPVHAVHIDKPFFISKTEITQDEWFDVMKTRPAAFDGSIDMRPAAGEIQGRRPVEMVSWHDAVLYCNARSIKEKLKPAYIISVQNGRKNVSYDKNADGYRLPTEAEWEASAGSGFTAAAASSQRWSGVPLAVGKAGLNTYAWFAENANFMTHETGIKMANSAGLFDMAGNVHEWCWDEYHVYPSGSSSTKNAINTGEELSAVVFSGSLALTKASGADSTMRVWRGGGADSDADECTVSARRGVSADSKNSYTGFRVVRTAR